MIFTDDPSTNSPATQTELDKRLNYIKGFINNDPHNHNTRINIDFNNAAFKLMHDCNLITEENINFLRSSRACKNFDPAFYFPRNQYEGVLRLPKNDTDTLGVDGLQRFRPKSTMYLKCNGQQYFISNDWYPHNKQAFYKWLAQKAQDALNQNNNNLDSDNNQWVENTEDSLNENDIFKTIEPSYDLEYTAQSLQSLHLKVDKLNTQIEELKSMWK